MARPIATPTRRGRCAFRHRVFGGPRTAWLLLACALSWVGLAPEPARAEGPPVSVLNPNAPAPVGFIAPTLDGDWRFRIALNGWLPNVVQISVDTGVGRFTLDEGLDWVLRHLEFVVPLDFEVRKGPFGAFVHTFIVSLSGESEVIGPVVLEWKNASYLLDVGLSYELGRWRLGDGERAPELTIEPYAQARIHVNPVDIAILSVAASADNDNTVPVLGLRTFIDLTEHWNLEIAGDYGGFGVDGNHQTWKAVGLIGYRWPGWRAHWNLQVGYRAMRLFDLRRSNYDAVFDLRGPNVMLGVEF